MPRHKKENARLVKRSRGPGRSDIWYIRDRVDGKYIWKSTKTDDRKKAKEILDAYTKTDRVAEAKAVEAEESAAATAEYLAETFKNQLVEKRTGQRAQRTPVNEGHEKWVALTPEHVETTEGTQAFARTVWRRFTEWCIEEGIHYIEDVDREVAVKYATVLRQRNVTAKTYNDYLKHLSRVFSRLDNIGRGLPHRNPFNKDSIPRKKRTNNDVAHHQPLEPDDLKAVLTKAAEYGADLRDLFIVASNTGMRLKDACLLKWEYIDGDFIRYIPHKTSSTSGAEAHVPIASALKEVLATRKRSRKMSEYVIPYMAELYVHDRSLVNARCQTVFTETLDTEDNVRTQDRDRKGRGRAACVIGFHSFRTTFMSLLASKDVSPRDAKRMLGWSSIEMVELYEHLLEKHRGLVEDRARKAVASIEELQMKVPEIPEKPVTLHPTPSALRRLVTEYSNMTIAQIYDNVSETAVRKWLKKYGIKRPRRIESGALSDKELDEIRNALLEELRSG